MLRRATGIIFLVIVYIFCLSFGGQAAEGDVIYVDDSAGGRNKGGSLCRSFRPIFTKTEAAESLKFEFWKGGKR